jgi:chromatin structure-remodeling complex subunit RSC1/2
MPINVAQKAAVEQVIGVLLGMQVPRGKRNLSGMFMELVDREEWPQYYEVRVVAGPLRLLLVADVLRQIIPEPRSISQIMAGLEKGRYKEASDVYTDLSLVFWNALFYNEPKSQIAIDAEALKVRG